MHNMIRIGDSIPDIELDAYHADEVKRLRLTGYRGRWLVIVTYPADFTFICPTELEDAARLHHEFEALGAEIVSVSTDTVWTHKAWHDASSAVRKVRFPMLADPAGKLCRALGTYLEDEGLSLRGTFIVDPDGILQAMEIHQNSIGRRGSETLRKLQAAVHVRETKGEVCPANWEPGAPTLTPGLALVGKL